MTLEFFSCFASAMQSHWASLHERHTESSTTVTKLKI